MTWRNLVENAIVVTLHIENHDLGNIGPKYTLYIFKNSGFWVLIKKVLIVFIVKCSMGFEGSPSLFVFGERGRGEEFSAQTLISLFVILWNIFGRHFPHEYLIFPRGHVSHKSGMGPTFMWDERMWKYQIFILFLVLFIFYLRI